MTAAQAGTGAGILELLLALLGLGLAQAVAVISPGPSFLVVTRAALGRSTADALAVTLGIGCGTLVWAGSALFGLTLLFAAVPWLYLALRLAGAGYLIWMAVMLWRGADAPLPTSATGALAERSSLAAARSGLFTQLANPKPAVFFGSIFITFLPPDPGQGFLFSALALTFVIEVSWYALVSVAFARGALRTRYGQARHYIDRITASVLAGLGLRLALAP